MELFKILKTLIKKIGAFAIQCPRKSGLNNTLKQNRHDNSYLENRPHCAIREDVHYLLDVSQLKFFYYGKCDDRYWGDLYFISPQFRERVSHILIPINDMLKHVHMAFPKQIPLFQYSENDLVFTKTSTEHNYFCKFLHHPKDYHGNFSNEPYSINLMFGEKDNSFFEVYYNQFGYIKRIQLICWKQSTLYQLFAKPFQNKLQITSAYKLKDTQKQCIFDIPRQERERIKSEYEWICKNLPDLAPKSLSAYTRMKNDNTKKYVEIGDAAFKLGFSL